MGLVSDKDFIVRMAEELGSLLAAALGLRKKGRQAEAIETLTSGSDGVLGVPRVLLDRLDSAGAARMLADPHRLRVYARILREEAAIQAELGQSDVAARQRAAELVIEATRLKGGVKPGDRAELLALGDLAISDRYLADWNRLRAPEGA